MHIKEKNNYGLGLSIYCLLILFAIFISANTQGYIVIFPFFIFILLPMIIFPYLFAERYYFYSNEYYLIGDNFLYKKITDDANYLYRLEIFEREKNEKNDGFIYKVKKVETISLANVPKYLSDNRIIGTKEQELNRRKQITNYYIKGENV